MKIKVLMAKTQFFKVLVCRSPVTLTIMLAAPWKVMEPPGVSGGQKWVRRFRGWLVLAHPIFRWLLGPRTTERAHTLCKCQSKGRREAPTEPDLLIPIGVFVFQEPLVKH